ncbi:MAG TPA: sulfurtransferase [Paenalcaligenes sp.]|nr:sulfurtransferase [Paenalcaligenes sp.]
MSQSILFSVAQAQASLAADDAVFIDTRYDLTDPQVGVQAYEQARIPGALFFDQSRVMVGRSTGKNGRHPLPQLALFKQLLQQLHLTPEQQIIVYDASNGQFAARLWWMLRWAGLTKVALLDGGWQAWQAAGGPVDEGPANVNYVTAIAQQLGLTNVLADDAKQGHMPLQLRETILAQLDAPELCIIDARTAERYRGEVEPLDPVAGHIPGAFNRPSSENLHSDGSFKSAEQLRAEWTSFIRGVSPDQVVHQCGSGITACHNLFAMELAGLSGSALYPGSWSEWVAHSGAPIDVG